MSTTTTAYKALSYLVIMLCASYAFRMSTRYLKPNRFLNRTAASSRTMATVQRISPVDFLKIVKDPAVRDNYQIIDVREKHELQAVSIPQLKDSPAFHHLSLSTSNVWADEVAEGELLKKDKATVVFCHHGVRSMQMATFLVGEGFTDVWNLEGGIHSYAEKADPSIGTY